MSHSLACVSYKFYKNSNAFRDDESLLIKNEKKIKKYYDEEINSKKKNSANNEMSDNYNLDIKIWKFEKNDNSEKNNDNEKKKNREKIKIIELFA